MFPLLIINSIQDGPFQRCSWIGGQKDSPSIKSVTDILQ